MTEIWPVIHVISAATAIENAKIAEGCGCTGVFVISMHGRDAELDVLGELIAKHAPGLGRGVNYLREAYPLDVFHRAIVHRFTASWMDYGGVSSSIMDEEAKGLAHVLAEREPPHRVFCGVAFKGQAPEPNPEKAARNAASLGFIPTTSGPRTGQPPDVRKVADMRIAVGGGPLAIASGITPENARSFAPHVTHMLVATGIAKDFHSIDESRLKALMWAVR